MKSRHQVLPQEADGKGLVPPLVPQHTVSLEEEAGLSHVLSYPLVYPHTESAYQKHAIVHFEIYSRCACIRTLGEQYSMYMYVYSRK